MHTLLFAPSRRICIVSVFPGIITKEGPLTSHKSRPYPKRLKELMGEKTTVLSKAQALSDIGMAEMALPLWETAASFEERIAPLLEAVGRDLEAAVHRISGASCY